MTSIKAEGWRLIKVIEEVTAVKTQELGDINFTNREVAELPIKCVYMQDDFDNAEAEARKRLAESKAKLFVENKVVLNAVGEPQKVG